MIAGLIVRDEGASIAETIASLRALLGADARIVVFDTGSVDDTAERAREAGAEVRHDLSWAPSGRYDDSYNAMLVACEAMAEPEEWIFHAYGRRLYEGAWSPPEGADVVSSTEHWNEACDATRPVAYRARLACRYQGATHERMICPPGVAIPDGGVRLRRHACAHPRPDRFERDLKFLEGETDPRSRFYYAQTLCSLERFEAAYAAYLARADMRGQGEDDEVVVALWRAIMLAPRHPALLSAVTRMAHGALTVDEKRAEPWQALSEFCLDLGAYDLAARYAALALTSRPDPRCLFLDPSAPTRARAMLEAIDSAFPDVNLLMGGREAAE